MWEKNEHWALNDTTHGHLFEMCHRLQYKMKRMWFLKERATERLSREGSTPDLVQDKHT